MGGKGKKHKWQQAFIHEIRNMRNEKLVDVLLMEAKANYITTRDEWKIGVLRDCMLYRLRRS